MRHNEKRSLRIIFGNFALPIVSQWGTSFMKKHQHFLHFLFARGVTTIVLVGGKGVADQDVHRVIPFVQLGQKASPPMKTTNIR
jgi:hypothetical protein